MIFIGKYKELCRNHNFSSMKNNFEKEPYFGQDKIIHYLKNGTPDLVSMETPKDVFTGECIKMQKIGMNDGKYEWFNTLAYYVEKYNLRLPKDFEVHILNSKIVL